MFIANIGQQQRPFSATPLVDHYFPAAAIETARNNLISCVERGAGPGLVIGPSGSGKTLLCLMLADQFRDSYQVAMLACGRLASRRALYQAVLYELGRPYRNMDEGELRLALIDYLNRSEENPDGMLLLVDEAQTLSLRLLEEIRLLSNLARDGRPLVRLVLAGGPALEERFANPKLDSFSQRLGARCYLETFNRTETRDYIQSRIDSTGVSGEEYFPDDACASVYQATDGMPRLINQVSDHAMLLACVEGVAAITPALVNEAWADLQQLPVPSCEMDRTTEPAGGGVIEFGSLDDTITNAEEHSTEGGLFRVTSSDDEECDEEDEPAGQIHRIEQLLAEADDDFQPAGSIGPEVELDFQEEPIHPFQEDFEEEEVVADRYAEAKSKQPMTFGTSAYAVEYDPPVEQFPVHAVCITAEPETTHQHCATIEDSVAAAMEEEISSAETRRREYRQLFSRLRRG